MQNDPNDVPMPFSVHLHYAMILYGLNPSRAHVIGATLLAAFDGRLKRFLPPTDKERAELLASPAVVERLDRLRNTLAQEAPGMLDMVVLAEASDADPINIHTGPVLRM